MKNTLALTFLAASFSFSALNAHAGKLEFGAYTTKDAKEFCNKEAKSNGAKRGYLKSDKGRFLCNKKDENRRGIAYGKNPKEAAKNCHKQNLFLNGSPGLYTCLWKDFSTKWLY